MSAQDWKDILNSAGKWSLALILIATVCYLALCGREVPSWLVGIILAVMGYYFGSNNNLKKAGE